MPNLNSKSPIRNIHGKLSLHTQLEQHRLCKRLLVLLIGTRTNVSPSLQIGFCMQLSTSKNFSHSCGIPGVVVILGAVVVLSFGIDVVGSRVVVVSIKGICISGI
jgi:hypothetical protein